MRKVFIEFAKHAFQDEIIIIDPSEDVNGIRHKYLVLDTTSFYDQAYKIINAEIENYEKPVLISWLSQQDKKKLRGYSVENISSINDPFGLVETRYTTVDYNFFRGKAHPVKAIRNGECSGKSSKVRKTG